MKIVNVVGARPQFIKYFPVSKAIENYNGEKHSGGIVKDVLIHTGQHYDYNMSKIFFDELGIKEPEYHLGIGSGAHGEQTGQIIQKVETVLNKEIPDVILVYGDTNSTLGAALAAAKIHVPVAHVEAGLRSFNKYVPEEINRILTDHLSTLLFCPSETAVKNLRSDGYKNVLNNGELESLDKLLQNHESKSINVDKNNPLIINVGDVMFDVLIYAVDIVKNSDNVLGKFQFADKDYNLLTIHRTESTDNLDKLHEIIDFVNNASTDMQVIFPMHPRTKKVYGNAKVKFSSNVRIIEPVSYFDLLMLLKNSVLVMTDSGGMQKEAYWLKIPCVTLRDETEWIETIQSGWNVLYKNYKGIVSPPIENNPCYGDGKASDRIVNVLKTYC